MYALVDCNNFYASCERVFNPKLIGKPIVVLSNNDGCIIARSQEAKDIGLPMGAPIHELRNMVELHNVQVFSANFQLYGDMSHRVMRILNSYVPQMEIYSIDESFLSMDSLDIKKDYIDFGIKMRTDILKSTGIPVSVGIAPTKVLAKICNHVAKKKTKSGVFYWDSVQDKDAFLKDLPVQEIWGVGRKTSYKLNELGIYNALQFKNCNEMWLRKNFSVTELRIATELKEIPCLNLETKAPRKNILSSRTFGKPVYTIEGLEEAVSSYITRGSEKLREQGSLASFVYVSIKTNMHRKDLPQYFNYAIVATKCPTAYNPDLIKTGFAALHSIFKPGFRYKKATIMLLGLVPDSQAPLDLFESDDTYNKKMSLMKQFDNLNATYGREVVKYASSGLKQPWRNKKEMCSPQYTTNWEHLLRVN